MGPYPQYSKEELPSQSGTEGSRKQQVQGMKWTEEETSEGGEYEPTTDRHRLHMKPGFSPKGSGNFGGTTFNTVLVITSPTQVAQKVAQRRDPAHPSGKPDGHPPS